MLGPPGPPAGTPLPLPSAPSQYGRACASCSSSPGSPSLATLAAAGACASVAAAVWTRRRRSAAAGACERHLRAQTARQADDRSYWSSGASSGDNLLEDNVRPRIQLLLQQAKQGDSSAQYLVGMAYLTGDRVEANAKKAVMYLSTAASNCVAEAQVQLGLVLLGGSLVARNVPQGVALIGAASEQAAFDADQSYEIAVALLGEEEQDQEELEEGSERARWAAHYFGSAAADQHVRATYEMGRLHLFGRGVERDPVKAAEWISAAANLGERDAQYLMGALLQSGTGVDKNTDWATHWFMEAARRGCEMSAGMLQGSTDDRAALAMARLELAALPDKSAKKAFIRDIRLKHHPDQDGDEEIFRWAECKWGKEYC